MPRTTRDLSPAKQAKIRKMALGGSSLEDISAAVRSSVQMVTQVLVGGELKKTRRAVKPAKPRAKKVAKSSR